MTSDKNQMLEKKLNLSLRNYQIDFLKLIFSICVVIYHSSFLIKEETRFQIPTALGWIAVHFFFIVSGFFMTKSITEKKYDPKNAGKMAYDYVIKKFKRIALPYWIATLLFLITYIYINYGKVSIFNSLISALPELFAISMSGITLEYNFPVWYISAMFLVMLPLGYLLIKNKDFFLYCFAPLMALFLYGYMYQQENKFLFYKGGRALPEWNYSSRLWIVFWRYYMATL